MGLCEKKEEIKHELSVFYDDEIFPVLGEFALKNFVLYKNVLMFFNILFAFVLTYVVFNPNTRAVVFPNEGIFSFFCTFFNLALLVGIFLIIPYLICTIKYRLLLHNELMPKIYKLLSKKTDSEDCNLFTGKYGDVKFMIGKSLEEMLNKNNIKARNFFNISLFPYSAKEFPKFILRNKKGALWLNNGSRLLVFWCFIAWLLHFFGKIALKIFKLSFEDFGCYAIVIILASTAFALIFSKMAISKKEKKIYDDIPFSKIKDYEIKLNKESNIYDLTNFVTDDFIEIVQKLKKAYNSKQLYVKTDDYSISVVIPEMTSSLHAKFKENTKTLINASILKNLSDKSVKEDFIEKVSLIFLLAAYIDKWSKTSKNSYS